MTSYRKNIKFFFSLLKDTVGEFVSFRFLENPYQMMYLFFHYGFESIPMLMLAFSIVGYMMLVEMSYQMNLVVQNNSLVPPLSSLMLTHELIPVLTSILLNSRIGSSISAEIATMRLKEEFDSYILMGIRPARYLFAPRLFCYMVSTLFLTAVSFFFTFFIGGYSFFFQTQKSSNLSYFFSRIFLFLSISDISMSFIKTICFSFSCCVFALYNGLQAELSAYGVGRAAQHQVMYGTFVVIVLDLLLNVIFF